MADLSLSGPQTPKYILRALRPEKDFDPHLRTISEAMSGTLSFQTFAHLSAERQHHIHTFCAVPYNEDIDELDL